MTTPLPCPHCGEALLRCEANGGRTRWSHSANGCINSRRFVLEHQLESWNHRPEGLPQPSEELRQWTLGDREVYMSHDEEREDGGVTTHVVPVSYETVLDVIQLIREFQRREDNGQEREVAGGAETTGPRRGERLR